MISRDQALKQLVKNKQILSKHTYNTIKGQIICGDVTGALKGLKKVLVR